MKTRFIKPLALVAIGVLLAAACSSSAKSGSGSTGGNKSTQTTANANDPSLNQWAQQYTGAKTLGKAAGAPFTIGYVNNDNLFPEATIGFDAGVAYANDNAAGHAGAAVLMQPIFQQAGAQVKSVFVPNEANGTQVQSAMQAIGAGDSDVFVSILTLQSCIGMYDAIKSLNIHPNVVT